MKKLGFAAALTLLCALPWSAAAADYPFLVLNNSTKGELMVTIAWDGGGLPPFKINPGAAHALKLPGKPGSAQMTVSGTCREATETFAPKEYDRAVVDCHANVYRIQLQKIQTTQ